MGCSRGFGDAGLGEDLPIQSRQERWFRPRRAVFGALGALLIVGLIGCSTATARFEPKIRVLLYSGTEPIPVVHLDGSTGIEETSTLAVDMRRWSPFAFGMNVPAFGP